MSIRNGQTYKMFSDPMKLYISMLNDIEQAKHYIYLETYKFSYQAIGQKFRHALAKKCREGVEVKLLIDSWGSSVSRSFFNELIAGGGEVRYFKKIKWTFDALSKHHRRDHRKLMIIDDEIVYLGSSNITDHCLNWRESNFKIKNTLAPVFKRLFLEHYSIYNKLIYEKKTLTQIVKHYGYEIIRDVPSTLIQPTRKRFMELIKEAKSSIYIETPYFLPGTLMRKALKEAGQRGIKVSIIVPKRSDVGLVDILRNKYLGKLYDTNIDIFFYVPQNLHSKIFVTDSETFVVGSSNFDYRSFRFQHEINLLGKNKQILELISEHSNDTLAECENFDYNFWLKRSPIQKFFERLLVPFRHFF